MVAQIERISAKGCRRVFREYASAYVDRPQLDAAIDAVQEGDTLVIARLDRLARSTAHFLSLVEVLRVKGANLWVLDLGDSPLDTISPYTRLMLTMFAAFAEFEQGQMLHRQVDGIQAAKAAGKYKGRAPTARAKTPEVIRLRDEGVGPSQIAKTLGIGRASVYRILSSLNTQDLP
jgi:DNA invertase Pin-like site-specific DNA recombinase